MLIDQKHKFCHNNNNNHNNNLKVLQPEQNGLKFDLIYLYHIIITWYSQVSSALLSACHSATSWKPLLGSIIFHVRCSGWDVSKPSVRLYKIGKLWKSKSGQKPTCIPGDVKLAPTVGLSRISGS